MNGRRKSAEELKRPEGIAGFLADCLSYSVSDALVRSSLDRMASPKPANLAKNSKQRKRLNDRIDKLCECLGAPPEIIVRLAKDDPPKYDTLVETTVEEILSAFHRSRRAVCRAQVCSLAVLTYKRCPTSLSLAVPQKAMPNILSLLDEQFYEHTETAYIRIAAYWDRVGHPLDFIFFNIRWSGRDGFIAVLDRLRANYVPVFPEMGSSPSWRALAAYADSCKADGLRWLLARRNLLAHSLHLRHDRVPEEGGSLYSLDLDQVQERASTKLKTGTTDDEIRHLNHHLDSAAQLFEHVLGICEMGLKLRKRLIADRRARSPGLMGD